MQERQLVQCSISSAPEISSLGFGLQSWQMMEALLGLQNFYPVGHNTCIFGESAGVLCGRCGMAMLHNAGRTFLR